MTDKKSNESRRKLLKSIAAGSGAIVAGKSLPDSWSRPVVDSVLLPTHAQTSVIEDEIVYTIVACSGESQLGAPTGQLYQTGGEVVENVSATVSPVPPIGTEITMTPTVTPVDLNYSVQTEPTDATGVASFLNLGLPNADPVDIGSVYTLRFEFTDQASFGNSFCEVNLTVIVGN